MPMDLAQLEQMVNWLDEERRKDKEEIARLRQRLEEQLRDSDRWVEKVQELEARLAAAQTQLAKVAQLSEAMDRYKEEIAELVDQAEKKQVAAQRDVERARLLEREAQTRSLGELRKEMESLSQMADALEARRTEEQRLNQALLELRKSFMDVQAEFQERSHEIRVIEERHTHDAKRIAQLQETTTELLRRTESQETKGQILEDALRKAEQRVLVLEQTRDDLRAQQSEFVEAQQLREAQRKRQMDDWGKAFEDYQKTMKTFAATMQVYKDFYDKNRHALEELEKLQTHLSQRQAELAELQRLSEERQKGRLQEWGEENEKRWKAEALKAEHAWNEQHRKNEAMAKRLDELEKRARDAASDMDSLVRTMDTVIGGQLSLFHQWQEGLDEIEAGRRKRSSTKSSEE